MKSGAGLWGVINSANHRATLQTGQLRALQCRQWSVQRSQTLRLTEEP
jgi:hypothetical protein